MRFASIFEKKDDFPVARVCRRLGVSTSGFCQWRTRGESARARSDRRLGTVVRSIHTAATGTIESCWSKASTWDANVWRGSCGRTD